MMKSTDNKLICMRCLWCMSNQNIDQTIMKTHVSTDMYIIIITMFTINIYFVLFITC